ncbi:MAG: hypothetical protein V3T74_00510 [Gemmatimonadales bacterium]
MTDSDKRLAMLVQEEARRMLSEAALEGDPKLLAEGWERRFMADGERAREAVELYEELGYEVRTEAVRSEGVADDCEDCQLLMLLKFQTIYTRRGAPK